MNDYQKNIVARIKDREKWPGFIRPDFIEHLVYLADGAFARDSIEGYLASMLIYQQVAEDFLHILIEDHEFFIQLRLFPSKIEFPDRKKLMFGRLIEELKKTIEFSEAKYEIIDIADRLRKIRNNLVHGLTAITKLDEIKVEVEDARKLFDELIMEFKDLHDLFLLAFKDMRKDIDWDQYFEE